MSSFDAENVPPRRQCSSESRREYVSRHSQRPPPDDPVLYPFASPISVCNTSVTPLLIARAIFHRSCSGTSPVSWVARIALSWERGPSSSKASTKLSTLAGKSLTISAHEVEGDPTGRTQPFKLKTSEARSVVHLPLAKRTTAATGRGLPDRICADLAQQRDRVRQSVGRGRRENASVGRVN